MKLIKTSKYSDKEIVEKAEGYQREAAYYTKRGEIDRAKTQTRYAEDAMDRYKTQLRYASGGR